MFRIKKEGICYNTDITITWQYQTCLDQLRHHLNTEL
jgi:hypothetical protein